MNDQDRSTWALVEALMVRDHAWRWQHLDHTDGRRVAARKRGMTRTRPVR